MAVIASFLPMDNKEGVTLNNIITSIDVSADPSVPAPPAKLGDRVQGNGGSEWVFVRASATVTCYNMVAIDKDYQARNITSANALSNVYVYGVAEFPPNQMGATVSIGNNAGGVVQPSDYFWAALKIAAGGKVNCITSAANGAKLYISPTTPGNLTTSATAVQVFGLAIVETLTTISVPQSLEFVQYGYIITASTTA